MRGQQKVKGFHYIIFIDYKKGNFDTTIKYTLQQQCSNKKILAACYSAQPFIAAHCSSKLKAKNIFYSQLSLK